MNITKLCYILCAFVFCVGLGVAYISVEQNEVKITCNEMPLAFGFGVDIVCMSIIGFAVVFIINMTITYLRRKS